MRRLRPFVTAALILGGAAAFVLWHSVLLTPEGRVRGFNSDSAIIALMGKKMLDARGFDIFFWGQNYLGPLTSIFTAIWGAILGAVDPNALRLAVFTEIYAGIVLIVWAISRIDVRAAILTGIALVITPPVLLRMMETPLGAEIAFFMGAILFAVLMQHVSARPGAGWLSRRRGQVVFGVLAGIGWWMNQQVVFTLMAGAIVLGVRSRLGSAILARLHLKDRLLLRGNAIGWRPMPGLLHALVWLMSATGWILLIAYIVADGLSIGTMPLLVFGPAVDPLILILAPQVLLPLILGEWRQWHPGVDRNELRALVRFAIGFAVGYAPVWLGAIAGWYERSYMFLVQPSQPADAVRNLKALAHADGAFWVGFADHPVGVIFSVLFCVLVAVSMLRVRSEARILLALVPLINALYFILVENSKTHYLISSIGMLFGLAAVGAMDLWDAYGRPMRAALVATALIAFVSIGMTAMQRRRDLLATPDPMPLLNRVRALDCDVCYAELWTAYRYRLLDGEQRAWIPYRSQQRTLSEARELQRLPGQRCLIEDGQVRRIASDLPLKFPRQR